MYAYIPIHPYPTHHLCLSPLLFLFTLLFTPPSVLLWDIIIGKSTLLEALASREVPIPDHIDIYHLSEEIAASDKTPLQCVMEVESERVRLEAEAAQLVEEGDSESDRLMDIYERLEVIDASTAESKAAKILHGLGFSKGESVRVYRRGECVREKVVSRARSAAVYY